MKEIQSNGLEAIIAQAIEEMKEEQENKFSLERINLAELECRTGVSRVRLRTLKKNLFAVIPHALTGRKAAKTVLTGYTVILDNMLNSGTTNSQVCFKTLQDFGYTGGQTTVKNYIRNHKDLVPAKRHLVIPQCSRGQRYTTAPGEAYQCSGPRKCPHPHFRKMPV